MVALNNRNGVLLTLGLSRGMNGVTLPIIILGTIRPEDSGAARVSALNCTAKPKSPAVWACFGVDGPPRHAQNPLLGERRKTLSIKVP